VDDSAGCSKFVFPRIIIAEQEAEFDYPDTPTVYVPFVPAIRNTTKSAVNGYASYTWKYNGKLDYSKHPPITIRIPVCSCWNLL